MAQFFDGILDSEALNEFSGAMPIFVCDPTMPSVLSGRLPQSGLSVKD